MDKNENELERIKEILRSHPKGLTIADIAKILTLNRISTSKYLNILLASGLAEMRVHGPSKVFYPCQRIPLSALLNFSTSLLLVMNDDLTIIDANTALLQMFSLEKNDLVGKRIEYSPLAVYFEAEVLDRIKNALDSQDSSREVRCVIKGRECCLKLKFTPTVFESGGHGVTLIAEDITELTIYRQHLEQLVVKRSEELTKVNEHLKKEIQNHKKARNELKKSEKNYRELVESTRSIIVRTDRAGKIVFFNEFAQSFLGYREDEILGKNLINVFAPPESLAGKKAGDVLNQMKMSPDDPKRVEKDCLRKDGSRVWISWTQYCMRDSKGAVTGIIFFGNDISGQKRTEARLQQSEKKFSEIINFLPDATFVIDTKGNVIAWNRAIEILTGVNADDILGKGKLEYALALHGVRDFILADYVLKPGRKVSKRYSNFQRDGDIIFAETFNTHVHPEGVYLWVKAAPIYDDSGKLIGVVESIRDITEMKRSGVSSKEDREEQGTS
jgi:PAS domain S-box-containing protein